MFNEARRAAWTEISTGNIRDNYHAIRALAPDSEMIACIKGDAYGHGIVKTARELVREGVEYLGVATIEEAAALRNAGILTSIVLLSPAPRGDVEDVVSLGLIPVITANEDAKLLSDAAVQFNVKEKIPFLAALETGMGRLGYMPAPESIDDIGALGALPGIRMLGIFSHFATADEPDLKYAQKQLEAFLAFDMNLKAAGVDTGKRTMANSAAIIALPESHFEIVRPGITLYGIKPSDSGTIYGLPRRARPRDSMPGGIPPAESFEEPCLDLKPAMSVKANIVFIKRVPPGFSVSYGRRYTTERESLIATLPIGYADGLPRAATGKARALVRGRYAPIVGTICMDLCMADVTDIPGVTEYDEVVLLGEQGENAITAEEIAVSSDTNSYEVVCRFGQRLPRIYV